MQEAEQRLSEHREEDQDRPGDDRRAQRHRPPLRRARPARQAGIDRRAARRIDDHEQGDERRDEQVDHWRSEEHTSELQLLMRISSAVYCLTKNKNKRTKWQSRKRTDND